MISIFTNVVNKQINRKVHFQAEMFNLNISTQRCLTYRFEEVALKCHHNY